jgi:hypothetical protein
MAATARASVPESRVGWMTGARPGLWRTGRASSASPCILCERLVLGTGDTAEGVFLTRMAP